LDTLLTTSQTVSLHDVRQPQQQPARLQRSRGNYAGYNNRGGNNYGYNDRGGNGYNNRGRYNNNFGRGNRNGFSGHGSNDFSDNWRGPGDAPPAIAASATPLENSQYQLPSAIDGAASEYTPPRRDEPIPDTVVHLSDSPSASVTNDTPVAIHANVSSAFSSSSSDNTVGGENAEVSANNIVVHAPTPKRAAIAPNLVNRGFASTPNTPSLASVGHVPAPAADPTVKDEPKLPEHVSDKTFEKVDEAFAMMKENKTLSLLEELNGADAAKLRDILEKAHAAKTKKTTDLMTSRNTIADDITTACGLEQKQERGVAYHHDRFVRKFEESLYVKNKESKMALWLQANKSIREAQQYGHHARHNRQKIETLRNEVTALDAKLFDACEVSSVKWAIGI
jgi:hypothetical protein